VDCGHGQRALDRDESADPGIAGFQFHCGQAVFDGGAAGAAVTLQMHAQDAQFAQLRGDVVGKDPAVVPVSDVRADLLVGEVADPLPEGQLIRGQQRVQCQDV
jgi:hypothetical protein